MIRETSIIGMTLYRSRPTREIKRELSGLSTDSSDDGESQAIQAWRRDVPGMAGSLEATTPRNCAECLRISALFAATVDGGLLSETLTLPTDGWMPAPAESSPTNTSSVAKQSTPHAVARSSERPAGRPDGQVVVKSTCVHSSSRNDAEVFDRDLGHAVRTLLCRVGPAYSNATETTETAVYWLTSIPA